MAPVPAAGASAQAATGTPGANPMEATHEPTLRLLSLNCCLADPGLNLLRGPLIGAYTCIVLNVAVGWWTMSASGSALVAVVCMIAATCCLLPTVACLVGSALQLAGVVARQQKRQRIDLLVDRAKERGWDVLVLQEVTSLWFTAKHRRYLIDRARAAGYRHVAACPERPTWPATLANSGLVVLSKHPVGDCAYLPYRSQGWFEACGVCRGALFVQLLPPASQKPVLLFTTHTTSPTDILVQTLHLERLAHLFSDRNSCGWRQLLEFRQFIVQKLTAHGGSPGKAAGSLVVVCGDLNLMPHHPEREEFSQMMAALELTPPLADVWEDRWQPTFALRDPGTGEPTERLLTQLADQMAAPKTLDYMFTNARVVASAIDRVEQRDTAVAHRFQQVSDHSGLDVTLAWRG